ncbi:MAG: SAM-dependent methyltransferase, partial [Paracoccaceae bacterium]
MEQVELENYGILSEGYDTTPPTRERGRTTVLLRTLFGGRPFALDFGDGDIRPMSDKPAIVHFAPPRFRTLLRIMINPGLHFGEAFMDGKWHLTKGRISDFLRMMVVNGPESLSQHGLSLGISERLNFYYKQFLATFSATREVARHYDVSAEIFRHIIGENLAYSSGFFDGPDNDLDRAQERKFRTIFERMDLKSTDNPKILDIGCGWGSLERYFPRDKAAEIDGISISEGQIAWAREHTDKLLHNSRIKARFLKEDYRFFCADNP